MNEAEIQLHAMATTFRHAIVDKDAARLAAVFALDADFVNIAAMCWSGRDAVVTNHSRMFARRLPITTGVAHVDTRLLRDDVALAMTSWNRHVARGASDPTLAHGKDEVTFVSLRSAQGWLFASARHSDAMRLPTDQSRADETRERGT
jgi:uncharacterized protein (TIGR02246 family)